MRISIKLTGELLKEICQDLVRPHPFAAERVGFVFGRIALVSKEIKLVLLNRYHPIPDDQYVDDPTVGARISSEAITWAMQAIYYGRARREGIFHIHMHPQKGVPEMSSVDRRELPELMPGFQSVGRDAAHGIVILSLNHGTGWVWLPGCRAPVRASAISVVGNPLCVFEPG